MVGLPGQKAPVERFGRREIARLVPGKRLGEQGLGGRLRGSLMTAISPFSQGQQAGFRLPVHQ
ncbi:MAG: hypothetical protein JKP98_10605 [Rhodobacteraceae bacterium]|nr:hypothetical protein [Paracoccaceae bacterium]